MTGRTGRVLALVLGTALMVTQSLANDNRPDLALTAQAERVQASQGFRDAMVKLLAGEAREAFELASALSDTAERRALQWAAIYAHGARLEPEAIAAFMAEASAYASTSTFRARFEAALNAADYSGLDLGEAFGEHEPHSVPAKLALAQYLLAEDKYDEAAALVKDVWTREILNEDLELEILGAFDELLGPDDHWARVGLLMMHDRIRAAERIDHHLSTAQRALLEARAATARRQDDGRRLLDEVDASLHEHPVYIYTRVQRARMAGLHVQAADWLARQPADSPEPTLWWTERRQIAWALLETGNHERAYEVAAGYASGPDGRLVESRFLAGFIALTYIEDPARAREQFALMTEVATLPDSITQAHFWLGRAEIALGDFAAADRAYGVAAQFPLVYYGQLARAELGLPHLPDRPVQQVDATPAGTSEMARAVQLLDDMGAPGYARILLRHWGTTASRFGDRLLAARLAQEMGAHNVSIAIAEAAERAGMPMDRYSFPQAGLPQNARFAAERAAVYAVARQESLFQLDAVSHAGARGLMQLMPGTAREVAGQLGVDYTPARLVQDAQYNILLGSTYLSTQLDRYGGSLLLAAAAYNAGPGNANRWIRNHGDPRTSGVDPVVWVELIPFQETRKYVQRVLGNYLVYRHLLGHEPMTIAEAMQDIR